ncbi:NAD(P)H-dependent oxidoreductase [Aquimarina agarivorans]|uniref:NAD(P)H-dependent oxidoreductase n=1 Tax=Aquimarina agarivorans TaxID=980584 RepID=UPI000248F002|nr:NAD(P)H-dependent oxidoreductase [Aquimarina agarivorans]
MDIIESLEWRYATKKFDNNAFIEDEKIERISKAFNLTATSYGLQPIKMIIVKNKSIQKKMKAASFHQEQVATASHVLVLCAEKNVDADFIKAFSNNSKQLRPEAHSEIDAYGDVLIDRFKLKSKADIKLWATKQVYLALGNLLTVCAIEKIDSCPMEGFIPAEIDVILGLEQEQLSAVLLLPIGYRAKNDVSAKINKVRRPLNDIVKIIP